MVRRLEELYATCIAIVGRNHQAALRLAQQTIAKQIGQRLTQHLLGVLRAKSVPEPVKHAVGCGKKNMLSLATRKHAKSPALCYDVAVTLYM